MIYWILKPKTGDRSSGDNSSACTSPAPPNHLSFSAIDIQVRTAFSADGVSASVCVYGMELGSYSGSGLPKLMGERRASILLLMRSYEFWSVCTYLITGGSAH